MEFQRRHFLKTAIGTSFAQTLSSSHAAPLKVQAFKISLAEWSLHRKIQSGELKNMAFPSYAKEKFGIHAVEYVNTLFEDKKPSDDYLKKLKRRCDDEGIQSLLIMIDQAGQVGDSSKEGHQRMLDKHKVWINAAAALGCHSVRVNAKGWGKSLEEQSANCVIGLTALCEEAKKYNLNVLVENHGGASSNGAWLVKTLNDVNLPNCGSLPDFGNFVINKETGEKYDRYQGIDELMPLAKAVSAKSRKFDADGNETTMDYERIIKIVLKHGYHGHIGIEFEGGTHSQDEGIIATKKLLERLRIKLG